MINNLIIAEDQENKMLINNECSQNVNNDSHTRCDISQPNSVEMKKRNNYLIDEPNVILESNNDFS